MSNRLKSFALATLVFSLTCGVGLAANNVVVKYTVTQSATSSDKKVEADNLILLSESTGANIKGYGLKVAQQPATNPSVPLSPDKQQRYQESVKLYKEGQELQKKGTKEGYQQAIEKYQQTLKIVEEMGIKAEQALINQHIGFNYFMLSDNYNALSYLNKSLEIWKELKQPIHQAELLSMIGDVYANTGNPKQAIEYFNQAKSIFLRNKKFENLIGTFIQQQVHI
jgi:tetratricopeptide (TPR) repeat protein